MLHRKPLCLLISLVIVFLFGAGCASQQRGSVVPGVAIKKDQLYFVERLPKDGRGINKMIADNLALRNLRSTTGEAGMSPEGVDIIVTYQDRWTWDMAMYMTRLNVQFKDAKDGDLLASGESYRTSLVRKSPEDMVDEVLDKIFEKIDQKLVTP